MKEIFGKRKIIAFLGIIIVAGILAFAGKITGAQFQAIIEWASAFFFGANVISGIKHTIEKKINGG